MQEQFKNLKKEKQGQTNQSECLAGSSKKENTTNLKCYLEPKITTLCDQMKKLELKFK